MLTSAHAVGKNPESFRSVDVSEVPNVRRQVHRTPGYVGVAVMRLPEHQELHGREMARPTRQTARAACMVSSRPRKTTDGRSLFSTALASRSTMFGRSASSISGRA